ncbi:C40 family peptidase [Chthonobacter rhizosphaerae]|uniref:C40 family peptidase n=1 Tax=Chthonobacter rhizosphaerae TaxID=2735553 RepID=UPI0015EEF681|nr:C40 family peptidase [Chthonobacter rhizosphaerae]
MTGFDRRLTPARPDLAAAHLEGAVTATRFVEGVRRRVVAPIADVRAEPRQDCPLDTQAIRGETVTVYEETPEGWAWGQLDRDGYVGWLPADALGPHAPEPTHRVVVLRTLVFPGPDLKLPVVCQITEGAWVAVVGTEERRGTVYARLFDGGYGILKHLAPAGTIMSPDMAASVAPHGGGIPDDKRTREAYVAAAERYVGSPYVWGGRTSLGLDCSGLVQTALAAVGISAPRDTDMQERALGEPVPFDGDVSALERGDLVFWKGHVGIVAGPDRLLHANGFHMMTVVEPLSTAIARIAAAGLPVTSVRRLN